MNNDDFDLDLLLQSFKDAGATIRPGTGKILLDGKEIDPMEVLQELFGPKEET